MSSKKFNTELLKLEGQVSEHFSELLTEQKEIIIFSIEDLEHDTPDYYLELRNDITGDIFDVHPLKVKQDGILCISADGSNRIHLAKLSDFSSLQDRINLCGLMEKNLD